MDRSETKRIQSKSLAAARLSGTHIGAASASGYSVFRARVSRRRRSRQKQNTIRMG